MRFYKWPKESRSVFRAHEHPGLTCGHGPARLPSKRPWLQVPWDRHICWCPAWFPSQVVTDSRRGTPWADSGNPRMPESLLEGRREQEHGCQRKLQ